MNIIRAMLVSIVAASLSLPALAEDFPTKPIVLIVPYAAGGNNDVSARILAKALPKYLGQPVIVENKGGAGGMIGGEYVATARPDGYTLLVGSNAPVIVSPLTFPKAPYHWDTAFEPISTFTLATIVLEVNKDLPISSIKEFVAYAKERPNKFSLASGGAGSINHMFSELLQQVVGVKWQQVHYRGNAPALVDLIGGHIEAAFDQLSSSLPQIRAGNIKAIAIVGDKRAPLLPDVPTFAEQGYPQIKGASFNGLLAPKGTPQPIIEKLNAAIRKALDEPEVRDAVAAIGSEVSGSSAAEFAAFLKSEDATWSTVVKNANIRVSQ